jgi:raffinose/stachyose/melibiose transport system permease protein
VRSMLGNRGAIALFVGPALIIYTLIMLVPTVWSLGYTFTKGSVISGFTFTGFDNYRQLGDDDSFWSSLWFTVKYGVVVTVGQVGFGLLLALLYTFHLKRASALIRTLVFFPVVLPTVAVAEMFSKVFEIAPQPGLVNAVLTAVGGNGDRDWLGGSGSAFLVIALMDVWRSMGFYAVLLYAGLVEIPEEILEGARLDGATGTKLVRHVVLPLLTPILLSSVVFSINGTLKVFDSIVALTNGGPGDTTTPLTLYMYNTAFSFGDYGYGSTIAMMLTLLSLLVTLFIFRYSRKDITQ